MLRDGNPTENLSMRGWGKGSASKQDHDSNDIKACF